MDAFRIAVKAFIVNDDAVLLVKREEEEVHKPGEWEIPGGRLEIGEDPTEGLKRETKEEVGLDVSVLNPLGVHHFTRDDGQNITMIVFPCRPVTRDIVISDEHEEHRWISVEKAKEILCPHFHSEVDAYVSYFRQKSQ